MRSAAFLALALFALRPDAARAEDLMSAEQNEALSGIRGGPLRFLGGLLHLARRALGRLLVTRPEVL